MKLSRTVLALVLALACGMSHAVTLRIANQGDSTSMDPHSLNEILQLTFTGNVYEPLIGRDKKLGLAPALAVKWTQISPTVWRFELRKGVSFHDGTPFNADDVVFTFKRAADLGGDMRTYTSPIKDVRKVGELVVDIETVAPFPILPDTLTNLYVISKKWCEDNKAEKPVDRRKGVENAASFRANGTGPYRLKERQPGTKTVLVRNLNHWDKFEGNVDEVIFTPIGNDATRVAALLSGEIDVMEPVPLQDVERIKANPNLNELTLKIQSETDQAKRNAMIREAFEIHANDVGHIPLHQQALAWGMKKNIELVQLPDNFMPYRWITVKSSPQ